MPWCSSWRSVATSSADIPSQRFHWQQHCSLSAFSNGKYYAYDVQVMTYSAIISSPNIDIMHRGVISMQITYQSMHTGDDRACRAEFHSGWGWLRACWWDHSRKQHAIPTSFRPCHTIADNYLSWVSRVHTWTSRITIFDDSPTVFYSTLSLRLPMCFWDLDDQEGVATRLHKPWNFVNVMSTSWD